MPHINCTKDATAFVALTSAELEHKAWIGFGLHIQAELRGGAFGFFPNHDPPIVEHGGFHHHSGEVVQQHRHFSEQPLGVDAVGGARLTGLDRHFQAKLPDKDGFLDEVVEIELAEVQRGGDGLNL